MLRCLFGASRGVWSGLDDAFFDPLGCHRCHSPLVQRHALKLLLGLHSLQAPHADVPEPLHVFDPAVGWLGDPLAFAGGPAAFGGLELGRHRRCMRVLPGVSQTVRTLTLVRRTRWW